MKVSLYNWVGTAKNLPEWFDHESIIDISLEQIQELFDTGNNVMLCHIKNKIVVFVDDGRFNHR